MPSAREVRPAKWTTTDTEITVLFDNGEYSVISGDYQEEPGTVAFPALGERWNGTAAGIGFPNVAGNPVWHVIPSFLARPVLHGLLDKLSAHPSDQSREYQTAIINWLQQPSQ